MAGEKSVNAQDDTEALRAENARLKKMVKVLMDRAERQVSSEQSGFNIFQTMVVLEEQVRRRTEALETLLRENEYITRALGVSEEKYRALVTNSLVGIGVYESGKIVFANEKLADIFGYSTDELLLIDPVELVAQSDRAVFALRLGKAMAGENNGGSYVYHGVTQSGQEVSVEMLSKRVQSGERFSLVFTCMDVTQRVKAEKKIKALNQKLRDMSVRDDLTGLYNRRYLDEMFARELARTKRHRSSLTIIMADIDHFKAVNDTYGHLVGDQILRLCGDLISGNARGSDICCRYGGEEFLLVCPDMAEETAFERANMLRSAIVENGFVLNDNVIHVSASFGIAVFPDHGDSLEQLIEAADDALYRAKGSGRNQVRSYSQK